MAPLARFKRNELHTAFKNDCQRLLLDFQSMKSYEFKNFAEVWQRHKFSLVYTNMETESEMSHFISLAFAVLLNYFRESEDVFVKLGAFYTLYGLYYKQPIEINELKKRIRLCLNDYKALKKFVYELKEDEHNEAVFLLAKMLKECAFDYVYSEKILAPDLNSYQLPSTKDKGNSMDFNNAKILNIKTSLNNLISNELEPINSIDNQYKNAMQKLKEKYSDFHLQIFNTNPLEEIKRICIEVENTGMIKKSKSTSTTTKDDANKNDEDEVGEKRRLLKNKASNSVSTPRKIITSSNLKRKRK